MERPIGPPGRASATLRHGAQWRAPSIDPPAARWCVVPRGAFPSSRSRPQRRVVAASSTSSLSGSDCHEVGHGAGQARLVGPGPGQRASRSRPVSSHPQGVTRPTDLARCNTFGKSQSIDAVDTRRVGPRHPDDHDALHGHRQSSISVAAGATIYGPRRLPRWREQLALARSVRRSTRSRTRRTHRRRRLPPSTWIPGSEHVDETDHAEVGDVPRSRPRRGSEPHGGRAAPRDATHATPFVLFPSVELACTPGSQAYLTLRRPSG